jgi:hypothetical protein
MGASLGEKVLANSNAALSLHREFAKTQKQGCRKLNGVGEN